MYVGQATSQKVKSSDIRKRGEARLLEPRSSGELRYRARRQLKSGTRDDDRLLGARRLRVCKRILGTPPPLSQLEIQGVGMPNR